MACFEMFPVVAGDRGADPFRTSSVIVIIPGGPPCPVRGIPSCPSRGRGVGGVSLCWTAGGDSLWLSLGLGDRGG